MNLSDPIFTKAIAGALALNLGMMAWLIKKTFGHTIPRLSKQYKDSLDKILATFEARQSESFGMLTTLIENQRGDFLESLTAQRAAMKNELRDLSRTVDRLEKAIDRLADRENLRTPVAAHFLRPTHSLPGDGSKE